MIGGQRLDVIRHAVMIAFKNRGIVQARRLRHARRSMVLRSVQRIRVCWRRGGRTLGVHRMGVFRHSCGRCARHIARCGISWHC